MEERWVRPDLDKPKTWDGTLDCWRQDEEVTLDLRSMGTIEQPVPAQFLSALEADGRIGRINCVNAVLGDISWRNLEFCSEALFVAATFTGDADFTGSTFSADSAFYDATFSAVANFSDVRFLGNANFVDSRFLGFAFFIGSTFSADSLFVQASFSSDTMFYRSVFAAPARFEVGTFSGSVEFNGATFAAGADLSQSVFSSNVILKDLNAVAVSLAKATFNGSQHELHLSVATDQKLAIDASGLRVQGDLVLLLGSSCDLDATGIVIRSPTTIVASAVNDAGSLDSVKQADITAPLRIGRQINLRHTRWGDHDLTTITLADVGTLHRVKPFTSVRWQNLVTGWVDRRFAGRRVLASDTRGADDMDTLAVVERNYRDLRRQLEATGNTNAANDFYYGEQDARRRRSSWATEERWLLESYRAISGYGTRVTSAIATWLLLTLAAARLLLINGVDITTKGQHLTWTEVWRFTLDASLSLFRPTNAPALSSTETLIMTTIRVLGPVMLALAALAVRNRVKR